MLPKRNRRPKSWARPGGFGATPAKSPRAYKHRCWYPVLNGVGTNCVWRWTLQARHHRYSIWWPCAVNDRWCAAPNPLFFLDYYATGKLNIDVAAQVKYRQSVAGANLAGWRPLVAVNTAEMPGM